MLRIRFWQKLRDAAVLHVFAFRLAFAQAIENSFGLAALCAREMNAMICATNRSSTCCFQRCDVEAALPINH
jgi:hypothetical protein